jgi:excisionase family DNA binding protein
MMEKGRNVNKELEGLGPILTVDEVSEVLGMHPLTVRRMARDGELPAFKVGRQWRIKRELFLRWQAQRAGENAEQARQGE